jgi:hypothetical protein
LISRRKSNILDVEKICEGDRGRNMGKRRLEGNGERKEWWNAIMIPFCGSWSWESAACA